MLSYSRSFPSRPLLPFSCGVMRSNRRSFPSPFSLHFSSCGVMCSNRRSFPSPFLLHVSNPCWPRNLALRPAASKSSYRSRGTSVDSSILLVTQQLQGPVCDHTLSGASWAACPRLSTGNNNGAALERLGQQVMGCAYKREKEK